MPDRKLISPEELNRKLTDLSIPERDLARYFLFDEDAESRPFEVKLQLDPSTVDLPSDPAAARSRSETAMTFANQSSRLRRRLRFERMLAEDPTRLVIVSEGDSWFQYPILLEDTIDVLYTKGFAVRSLDAAGDTLANMVRQREYLEALRETGAPVFLFSGGGNDVLGGGNLREHLRDFDPALSAEAHLMPSFQGVLDHTLAQYEKILRDVNALDGVVTICHGYDRVLPNGGKWLGKPMISRGITNTTMQRAITAHMIDLFNDRLKAMAATFGDRVVHVDARGEVGSTLESWHDELHPRNAGYARVAARFEGAIRQAMEPVAGTPRGPRAARGSTAGGTRARGRRSATVVAGVAGNEADLQAKPVPSRTGVSLHIGLNEIDAAHYGDNGQLFACHHDAQDMADLAEQRGFRPLGVLLDGAATRSAVISAIREAGSTLKAGDVFLFTYAGHGSQLPDFNHDESDGSDETLCLYDGMLIDDELHMLWAGFAPDVRIVMVSDSCHSGTVSRAARRDASLAPRERPAPESGERSRLLPPALAGATYRRNRAFYDTISRELAGPDEGLLVRALNAPVHAQVLLLSGCQDNQESKDGVVNGRFTQELLTVWGDARFEGDWVRLHQQIVANMPPSQTPNLHLSGTRPEMLCQQVPFVV